MAENPLSLITSKSFTITPFVTFSSASKEIGNSVFGTSFVSKEINSVESSFIKTSLSLKKISPFLSKSHKKFLLDNSARKF